MDDLNVLSAFEIGEGAGNFEEAVVGAGGEAEMLNGGAEERLYRFGGSAVGADLLGT